MPGNVTINEAQGQPTIPADADHSILVIGCSSAEPVGAPAISTPYSSPVAFFGDYKIGDGADMLLQGLTKTPGNPAPQPMQFARTPATNDGTYGTIDRTDMVGTCLPTEDTTTSPLGTWQIRVQVADDGNDGAGTTIGTSGVELRASLDDGRTWLPRTSLGTATTFTVYFPAATPIDTGVKFSLDPPTAQITALVALANDIKAQYEAHRILTAGSVHGAADSTNVVASSDATNLATAITLLNEIKVDYNAHRILTAGSVHGAADTTNAVTAADATDGQSAIVLALALRTAYEAHRVLTTGSVHGAADTTDAVSATNPTRGTLITGDEWAIATFCPTWDVADLYTAGSPPTGTFADLAESDYSPAIVVISEPVAAADFSTIIAGINYLATVGKEPWLIVRFRDPTSGETDSAYITAFRTWAAACVDDRVTCVAGTGRLTDAFRGYVYQRTGAPAVLARIQANSVVPGKLGERIAQSLGYVARGPLENFSIVDSDGNLIGHDEQIRSGIEGPVGATGGGLTFYRIPNVDLPGTYVASVPTLYSSTSEILTGMDRRLANGIKRVAAAIAWQEIQGSDVYDPVTFALDEDLRDGIAAKIASEIRARYGGDNPEFQNVDDPNLVTINDTVTVSGADVYITGSINVRFYGYTKNVTLTFNGSR